MGLACKDNSGGYPTRDTGERHLIIEDPNASENITLYYTDTPIRITKMVGIVSGLAATPSVTWSVRHDPLRAATGTEVVTGGTTTTDSSSGHTLFGFVGKSEVTSFNSYRIPANSFLWVTTTAVSGDVSSLSINVYFEED